MKKLVSVVISLSLIFTMSVQVFATGPNISDASQDTVRSEIVLSDGSVLIAEDLPNGDAIFTLLSGNEVVAESQVDRSANSITSIDYREANPTEEIISLPEPISAQSFNPVPARVNGVFDYRGRITYNYYSGTGFVAGSRSLDVLCDYDYTAGSTYNINGIYQNITSFAGYLLGILALPAAIASSAAAGILTALGIASSSVSFLIPDNFVSCNKTQILWQGRLTDMPAVSTVIGSSKYEITQSGYASKTYYDQDYWELTSYANHSTAFAVRLYWALLGEDTVDITNWA